MLTDKAIQNLKPREKIYDQRDENTYGKGTLWIRIYPSGRKSFQLVYSIGKLTKRKTIGIYGPNTGGLSLLQARVLANQIFEETEPTTNTSSNERSDSQAVEADDQMPFSDFSILYMEKYSKVRKKSWREDQRYINHDLLPYFSNTPLVKIQKKNVVSFLDGITGRDSPIAANRAFGLLRKMMNFAIQRSLLESNPCDRLSLPSPEKHKTRFLSDNEISVFWATLNDESIRMHAITRTILQFALVSGQRAGEVLQLRWCDIEDGWWTIPENISKNKIKHRVPLSRLALNLLSSARIYSGVIYVFPSPHADRVMKTTVLSHAILRNAIAFGIPSFTPHDLRRTAATHMGKLGYSRFHIDKVLNHVDQTVTGIYDLYNYDREKRDALEAYSAHIEDIIGLSM